MNARKECDGSLLNSYEGMKRTPSFDKDPHSRALASKVPFTGSVVTRDPPFYYATICRGYSLDKTGETKANLPKNAMQRGTSSHELLAAAQVDLTPHSSSATASSVAGRDPSLLLGFSLSAGSTGRLDGNRQYASAKDQPKNNRLEIEGRAKGSLSLIHI